jgi:signal transduction histidine kinase
MGVAVLVTPGEGAPEPRLVTFRWQPRGLAIWPEAWRRPALARLSEAAGIAVVVIALGIALALGLHPSATLWIGAVAAVVLLLLRYQVGWWLSLLATTWVAWAVWVKDGAGATSDVMAAVLWMAPFITVASYTAWQVARPFANRRRLWVGWPAVATVATGVLLWWLARLGSVPVVVAFTLAMAAISVVLALTVWAWMDRVTALGAPAPYGGSALPSASDAGERSWARRLETAIDRALPSSHWRLVYERDERRAQIARTLHGEVQPMLAAALWALAADDVERAQRNVRDARFALAELAEGQGPPILARNGLVAATRWMAETSAARWAGTVEVNIHDVSATRPPPRVELAAYNVAQHAVVNALRHTPSHRVRLELWTVSAARVGLSVLDEGPGIDLADALTSARAGSRGMAEIHDAAAEVDADVIVERRPEGGTEVRFSWRRGR